MPDLSQQSLIASMIQYEKIKLESKDELKIKNAKDIILKNKYEVESQRAAFYKNNPRFAILIYPKPASLESVQNWLIFEQKKYHKPIYFINYFIGNKNAYGWIIGVNRFEMWELPKIDSLEMIIREYNYKISQNTMTPEYSNSIRKKLIPIEIEKFARVYLATDGLLNSFPFSTLIHTNDKKPTYWVNSNQISLIPSISTFLAGEDVRYKNQSLLLVSGPITNNGKGLSLSSTDNEIKSIQQSWPVNSKSYYHNQISLNDFLSLPLNQYRFLHFATHARSDSEIAELSGLAFQHSKGVEYMSLSKIYGLNLSSQLVTLSSCDSGTGKTIIGEGVISLARGFLYAGSKSVLATLWKVPDRSSNKFMVQFYQHLSESFNPIEALNKTQNAAILGGGLGRTLRNPAVWSAFTIITN